jgi:hypothetical protein
LGGAEDDVKDNERACGAPMFDNALARSALGGAEDDVKDNERACGAPMFDNLQDRLGEVFDRLKRRGALSESDVAAALREVRVALLEADSSRRCAKRPLARKCCARSRRARWW